MTVPLRFRGTQPVEMGVEAAVVKMSMVVAQEAKGAEPLTANETRYIHAVAVFLSGEYERLAGANEEQEKQITELETRLLEISRLAGEATDG